MADVRTLTPLERILYLKSMGAIAELPSADLARFASIMKERKVKPGEKITELGAPIEAVYVLMDGRVSLRWEAGSTEVEAPSGLNWLRLLARRSTSREATALAPCHLLYIDAPDFLRFLESNPDTLENMLRNHMKGLLELRGALPEVQDALPEDPVGERPSRKLTIVERIDMMEQAMPLWGDTNFDALVTMARRQEEVWIPAGTQLWAVGDPADGGYFIRYGRVVCSAPDGTQSEVGASYGLGFFDAMAGVRRSQTAVARTDVLALHSQTANLYAVFENDPNTGMRMLATVAGQFADMYDRVRLGKPT